MIFEEIVPTYQFILIDVNILMFLLVCIMLFTVNRYQANYSLQAFWIVAITLFGVIAIDTELGNLWFQIICMLFTVMLNIFYLNVNLRNRA